MLAAALHVASRAFACHVRGSIAVVVALRQCMLVTVRVGSLSGRNFNKKILHHSHHPNRNLVAIGARNSLYLFAAN